MKRLNVLALLVLLSSHSLANSDGIYLGLDSDIISFGQESMKVENSDKSISTYHNIKGKNYFNIKLGYRHFDNNRVELYFRKNDLKSSEGDISIQSYGINYEWSFSSIMADSSITPFVGLGLDVGRSTSSKLSAIDNVGVGVANLALGIRYAFDDDLDIQTGYRRMHIVFDNLDSGDDVSAIGHNSLFLGISYKFVTIK